MERAHLWRRPGGYEVSVPEIDELVDIALSVPGVVGAGIVGAGLGGSMVAVVSEQHAQELVDDMESRYYRPRGLPVRVEIVAPVGGAGVLDV
ncbi:Galactokinase [subsurface metagenome]